MIFSTMRLN